MITRETVDIPDKFFGTRREMRYRKAIGGFGQLEDWTPMRYLNWTDDDGTETRFIEEPSSPGWALTYIRTDDQGGRLGWFLYHYRLGRLSGFPRFAVLVFSLRYSNPRYYN